MVKYGCKYEGKPGRCFAVKMTEPCCGYENCEKFKPNSPTNADSIRAMSDAELAEWLASMKRLCECCVDEGMGLDKCLCPTKKQCMPGILAWLKQPREENIDV